LLPPKPYFACHANPSLTSARRFTQRRRAPRIQQIEELVLDAQLAIKTIGSESGVEGACK
jgi:hypothetical protein